MIEKVETPRCVVCGNTGTVVMTAVESWYLRLGFPVQKVLSQESAAVREQVRSGTHVECAVR